MGLFCGGVRERKQMSGFLFVLKKPTYLIDEEAEKDG